MSKKQVAQFVQYDGAVYRLAGGLGTTRSETNVSLFDTDFDSEGELQYSGTPDGGQFFFESRVKFPDGTMLPISMQIDEDSAVEIVRKLAGDRPLAKAFPDKWKSQLPESFVRRVLSEDKGLPETPAPKELSAAVAGKQITATILPWRTIPETTVSKIRLRLGALGEDKRAVGLLGAQVQRVLAKRYQKARIAVQVDGALDADSSHIHVLDTAGHPTDVHDSKIAQIVSTIWQQMQEKK